MEHLKRIAAIALTGALITLDALLTEPHPRLTHARWRRYYQVIAPL